jgi:subtilisin family serine protease
MALSDEEVLFSTEMGNRIDDDDDDLIDEAFGHGTHVAGIVHTVAPRAILLPIRVLNDDGVGSLWDLILGLQLAHEYGATVVNLSLSLSGYSEFFEHALSKLDQAGISLVGAAGNHGWQDPVYPATSPLVLGVAALDTVEAVAAFSGAGPLISVAAPGTSVMSSYPGDLMVGGTGTSMATPIVSGTIAIVRECGNSAPEAQQIVCETAVVVPPEAYAPKYGRVVPLEAAKRKGNG